MLAIKTHIKYYFSGVAGFVITFGAIVTPATYYLQSVQADATRPTLPQLTANYLRYAADVVTTPKSKVATIKTPTVANNSFSQANQVPFPNSQTAQSILEPDTNPRTLTQPNPISQNDEKLYYTKDTVAEVTSEYHAQRLVKKFQVGRIVRVEATAYCLKGTTASGIKNKYGIVAADPKLLPIGSVVRVYDEDYSGVYTVMDTGCLIKGRKIDIYLQDSQEALRFGRRKIALEILRYGWDPQATSFPSANPDFTGEPNISPDKAKTAGPQINAQAADR